MLTAEGSRVLGKPLVKADKEGGLVAEGSHIKCLEAAKEAGPATGPPEVVTGTSTTGPRDRIVW